MSPMSDSVTLGSRPFTGQVHVIGAGPVGLILTALLQSIEGLSVHLYEKRREYTRTRMVKLAPYLVADSVESYRTDHIDGENVEAVFDPLELDEGLAFRQSIPSDLMVTPAGMVARVLSAQRHRAVAQRPDRRATVEHRAAHLGRRDGGGRDGDARAGEHPDRLHGQQLPAPRPPDPAPTTWTTQANTSRCGSSTRSSSRSCTASRTTATSTASTTRTSRTRSTSSSRRSTAPTTTATSAT